MKIDSTGTTLFSWMDGDQLAAVAGPNGTVSFIYDADGNKIAENADGVTTNYLIDTRDQYTQIIAEYGTGGAINVHYLYGLERISRNGGGITNFYLYDGQNSVRQLTDGAGGITDTWDYFAYGEQSSRSGTTGNRFTYTGEEWNQNAGLYFLRARWMDPKTGNFVSADPIAGDALSPVTLNKYLYANANPVIFTDPNGTFGLGAMAALSVLMSTLLMPTVTWAVQSDCDDFKPGPKWTNIGSVFSGMECDLNCTSSESRWLEDDCGNRVELISEPNSAAQCGFVMWYTDRKKNKTKVGQCVFSCGQNSWEVLFNKSQRRFVKIRHAVSDIAFDRDCDELTKGKFNSQWTEYDIKANTLNGWCREGSSLIPDWIKSDNGSCKRKWWH